MKEGSIHLMKESSILGGSSMIVTDNVSNRVYLNGTTLRWRVSMELR